MKDLKKFLGEFQSFADQVKGTPEFKKNKKLGFVQKDIKKILKDKENIEYKISTVLE
jgi:hypothetical protein